jgi:hypothetical protein
VPEYLLDKALFGTTLLLELNIQLGYCLEVISGQDECLELEVETNDGNCVLFQCAWVR